MPTAQELFALIGAQQFDLLRAQAQNASLNAQVADLTKRLSDANTELSDLAKRLGDANSELASLNEKLRLVSPPDAQ